MIKEEQLARYEDRNILINACVGLERYKRLFGSIPYAVLDIGAHIGGLTLQAMRQGVPYVLAIEADEQNYMYLTENVKRQTKRTGYIGHVECLHRAFCDTSDNIVEIIGVVDHICSSCQRSMFYSKSAKNIRNVYMVKHAKTINIDGIIEKLEGYGIYTIDLYKCDIEGAEFIAMPMNDKTKVFLSHIKYVDIEFHPWTNSNYYDIALFHQMHPEFDKNKRTVPQYFEFMRGCGFYIPDDMLRTIKQEYLKLTTYNKLLCGENKNAIYN